MNELSEKINGGKFSLVTYKDAKGNSALSTNFSMTTAIIMTPDELRGMLTEAAKEGALYALKQFKPPEKKHYTVEEVAEMMKCTPKTVRERIRAGKIGATKHGRSFLITKKEIETYLK